MLLSAPSLFHHTNTAPGKQVSHKAHFSTSHAIHITSPIPLPDKYFPHKLLPTKHPPPKLLSEQKASFTTD